MGEKNKESTWSTCCVLLTELVSLLQLVKPPLIYVLRGHDIGDEDKYGTRCLLARTAARFIVTRIPPHWDHAGHVG